MGEVLTLSLLLSLFPVHRLSKLNTGRKKKMKRDPGIPNLWPHKDKLLRQIEAKQRSEQ